MEGLSIAASGFAVASVAVQVAKSVKKICVFWKSIEDAPDDIQEISVESELLLSVLAQIANEAGYTEPNNAFLAAIKSCFLKVKRLITLLGEIEPGFSSSSSRVWRWTSIKAVIRAGQVKKFKKALESAKVTLVMAQQNQLGRLSHTQHLFLVEKLSRLGTEYSGHVIHGPPSQIQASHDQNDSPWPEHPQLIQKGNTTVRGYLREPGLRMKTLKEETATIQCFLGTIHAIKRETRQMTKKLESSDDQGPYNTENVYDVCPAPWLTRLGIRYGLHLALNFSSIQGWKHTLQPLSVVPDDALIFDFCMIGDVSVVRQLFLEGHASPRDTDSGGYTPLHLAAFHHHTELCKFLKSAGADISVIAHSSNKTPVELATRETDEITCDKVSEARDTIRILADSLDFSDRSCNGDNSLLNISYGINPQNKANERQKALLLWFVKFFSFEIKAFFSRISQLIVLFDVIGRACDTQKAADTILSCYGEGLLGESQSVHLLHHFILCFRKPYNTRFLFGSGIDPHYTGDSEFLRGQRTSPTSLAMFSLRMLWNWLRGLVIGGVHLGEFTDRELQKNYELYPGWNRDLLIESFAHAQQRRPSESREWHAWDCNGCNQHLKDCTILQIQPFWRHCLERIKHGIDPEYPTKSQRDDIKGMDAGAINSTGAADLAYEPVTVVDADSADVHEHLPSEVDLYGYPPNVSIQLDCMYAEEEMICEDCWLYYIQTGARRGNSSSDKTSGSSDESSEEEYSPYLIHT